DRARLVGILLEELAQLGVAGDLDQAADRWVPQLRLGLALELRLTQLDRDDRGQSLPAIVAAQRLLLLLQQALRPRVVVERTGQRGLEAAQMGTALVRVDVVGKRERRLDVAAVPLHRHL